MKNIKYIKPIINKLVFGSLVLGLTYGCGGDEDNNTPPDKPIPVKGESFVCEELVTKLSWTCSDPDGDELIYNMSYGTSPDLSNQSIYQTKSPESGHLNLKGGTKYYWQVTASDGKSTTKGDIWEFSTKSQPIESGVPNTPLLLSPKSDLTTTEVTFKWREVSDDGGSDNITYYLIINGEETILEGITEYKQALSPGVYEWYVVAYDLDGNSAESEHVTFNVN